MDSYDMQVATLTHLLYLESQHPEIWHQLVNNQLVSEHVKGFQTGLVKLQNQYLHRMKSMEREEIIAVALECQKAMADFTQSPAINK